MLSFLKSNISKYLWLSLIILQQVFVIMYLNTYILNQSRSVIDNLVCIFILTSIIYIFIAGFIRSNEDRILRKIIIIISFVIWQHLFILNQNSVISDTGLVLQPIVIYLFTVESLNLILYEKIEFKRKLDRVVIFILSITLILFFLNRTLFNLAYLLLFIGLHFYPLVVLMVYKDYLGTILLKICKDCKIFTVYLIGILLFGYVGSMLWDNEIILSNFGWYLMTITICIITFIRVVQDSLTLKIRNVIGETTFISFLIVFGLIILWSVAIGRYIPRFELLILIVSVSELFVFIITLYINIYVKYREHIVKDTIEDSRLISVLQNEEKAKEKFAIFLHDDILQSLIAIKNLIQCSDTRQLHQTIMLEELNNLVKSIRNEIDTYHPIIHSGENLKNVYCELIKNIEIKYQTNKKISFRCQHNISLYSPYDSIIYRIIKELVHNAVKYSSGYEIELSLDVKFDKIYIESKNAAEMSREIKMGVGLTTMKKRIEILRGSMAFALEENVFSLEIIIPMNRRACYENFID